VAAVVAAAAATVATGGTALAVGLAVAGVVLAAYSEEITGVLVQCGMPEDLAPYASLALKIAGSVMAGGGVLAVAGAAAAGLAGPVASVLREAGVAEEVCVAAEVVQEVDRNWQAASDLAHSVEISARVHAGANRIAAAEASHRSAEAGIDAEEQSAVSEEATTEIESWMAELKSTMKSFQRMLAIVQQTAEARHESMMAATRGRG
jgi:hypothetical protein